MNLKSIAFLISMFAIITCTQEDNKFDDIIDPELQKYVDIFFREAENRGLEMDKNNLQVLFAEIEDFCGYGYSNYNNTNVRRVEIDQECWSGMAENQKESLMLHELGHAILNRSHLNTIMPNGLAKSIMCGTGTNYGRCSGSAFYSSFLPQLQTYYIDELFDMNIASPNWANAKTKENGKIIFQENFESESKWTFAISDTISSITDTYSLDISFNESLNSKAATIHSTENRQDNIFALWKYEFNPEIILEGSILELKATISTNQLEGEGACLAFRTDSGTLADFEVSGFASTENEFSILGTDQNQFTITIPYCPIEIFRINLYLIIHKSTKGEIAFDDLELTVYE